MQLNQFYGIFGRKLDLLNTVNIMEEYLSKYVKTYIIKSIIEINDNILTLLVINNLNPILLKDLKSATKLNINNSYSIIKTNVAAVTAYARIVMIPYKLNTDCYYTDTDSIFSCSSEY